MVDFSVPEARDDAIRVDAILSGPRPPNWPPHLYRKTDGAASRPQSSETDIDGEARGNKPKLTLDTNVQANGQILETTTAERFGTPHGTFIEGYEKGFLEGYFRGFNEARGHETPGGVSELASMPLNSTDDYQEGYVEGSEEGFLRGREAGLESSPDTEPKRLKLMNPDSESKDMEDGEVTSTPPRTLIVTNPEVELNAEDDKVEPPEVLRVSVPGLD
jgi:hypothetical protein